MLTPVGEQREDLDRPVLNRRSQIFDRHGRQGWLPETGPQVRTRPGRITDFQAGDRGDADQARWIR
jgi:hypothetical protein